MKTPPLDIKKARVSAEFKHPTQLFRARFSPCGKVIAAIGVDTAVHLWNIEDKAKKSFLAHKTWVSAMCFSPGRNELYTADYHGVIHCWNYLGGPGSKMTTASRSSRVTAPSCPTKTNKKSPN